MIGGQESTGDNPPPLPNKEDFVNKCVTKYKFYCKPDNNYINTMRQNCASEVEKDICTISNMESARFAAVMSCIYAYDVLTGKTGYTGCWVNHNLDDRGMRLYGSITKPDDLRADDPANHVSPCDSS